MLGRIWRILKQDRIPYFMMNREGVDESLLEYVISDFALKKINGFYSFVSYEKKNSLEKKL